MGPSSAHRCSSRVCALGTCPFKKNATHACTQSHYREIEGKLRKTRLRLNLKILTLRQGELKAVRAGWVRWGWDPRDHGSPPPQKCPIPRTSSHYLYGSSKLKRLFLQSILMWGKSAQMGSQRKLLPSKMDLVGF